MVPHSKLGGYAMGLHPFYQSMHHLPLIHAKAHHPLGHAMGCRPLGHAKAHQLVGHVAGHLALHRIDLHHDCVRVAHRLQWSHTMGHHAWALAAACFPVVQVT